MTSQTRRLDRADLPAPGGGYAMGFVRGGRAVWAHAYGLTALYDLRPSR